MSGADETILTAASGKVYICSSNRIGKDGKGPFMTESQTWEHFSKWANFRVKDPTIGTEDTSEPTGGEN